MGYSFLLDPTCNLLSIGYRVADGILDLELLRICWASEARLASFHCDRARAMCWPGIGSTSVAAVTPIAYGAALDLMVRDQCSNI